MEPLMSQNSSVATGGVTFSVVAIIPSVEWALNGFTKPVPESASWVIAAAVLTLGHLVVNLFNAWLQRHNLPQMELPAAPTPQPTIKEDAS